MLLYTHSGSFFLDCRLTDSVVDKGGSVVLAGVEGGDVVALMVVVFRRLSFSWWNRDRIFTELTSVSVLLPHGNLTGGVRNGEAVKFKVSIISSEFINVTFCFTGEAILHQSVSIRTGAFCSRGSQ